MIYELSVMQSLSSCSTFNFNEKLCLDYMFSKRLIFGYQPVQNA
jgi:hypothetical protein